MPHLIVFCSTDVELFSIKSSCFRKQYNIFVIEVACFFTKVLVYLRDDSLIILMDFHKAKFRKPSKHSKYIRTEPRNSTTKNRGYKRIGNNGPKNSMHDATCGKCGTSCKIPFEPRQGRPVLCSDCFRKIKPRDGRHQPTQGRAPRRNKKEKTRDASFRKKKDYFEGGSDTFYASLREKLFEILGGKKCANCGFSDERALGFSDVDDNTLFDSIKRGGSASSYGKYISDPDLARKKLRILCLNCNQIK